ncbi:hypothetical protein HUG17_8537 [Dermatophagoides farinae]|nr:hypothetical protein HUG17_8537 [Dermatophagoides farinae]
MMVTIFSFASLNEPENNKNHYVCWQNRVDFIVQFENGRIFAFRHDKLWPLKIYENYLYSSMIPYSLQAIFPGLPNDIPMAFTMPLIDDRMHDHLFAIPGLTMFVDPPKYYLYHNWKWNLTDTMQYWETGPFMDNRFTATMHNASLLLIAKNGVIPDGIKKVIGGQVFLFDSDRFPEWVGVFEIANKYKQGLDWLRLSQLIPINPGYHHSRSNYLAIFDYGPTNGHYYCITQIDNDQCLNDKCHLRPLSSVIQCPDRIDRLKSKDSLYRLWHLSGGWPLPIIIIVSSGLAMAMLIFNLIQLINSVYLVLTMTRFGTTWVKCQPSTTKLSLTSLSSSINEGYSSIFG